MEIIYSSADSSKMDSILADKGFNLLLLMENAAFTVTEEIVKDFPSPCRISIICGKGNNGGDGLAVARQLLSRDYEVSVFMTEIPEKEPALSNFRCIKDNYSYTLLSEDNLELLSEDKADLFVDAIFGTGFHGTSDTLTGNIISILNNKNVPVYSIDIPSGVNATSGEADIAVKSKKTITFQHPKLGHFLSGGKTLSGEVIVKRIADEKLLSSMETRTYLADEFHMRKRDPGSNKYDFGRCAVVAGSVNMTGAAIMSIKSAMTSGAGLVTYLGCDYTRKIIQTSVPEVMCRDISKNDTYIACDDIAQTLNNFDAFLMGPGIARNIDTEKMVLDAALMDTPKVLDADALYFLSFENVKYGKNTVITPHTGEFSRLTGISSGEIRKDPLKYASEYAKKHGIVMLLKGSTTIITDGTESILVTRGTPGMAKAGSGDVLAGVIVSLLAQGYSIMESAYGGAYICGAAGEISVKEKGEHSISPLDTLSHIPDVLKD